MAEGLSSPRKRARLAGFFCGLGIFVVYVSVFLLSWETTLARTATPLSLGNLGLDHLFLPSSLNVGFLVVPPVLITTLGIYWADTADGLGLLDVLAFLQYEIVFPLFFAAIIAFCLGIVSFIGDVSPTVGGILSLVVVGLFSGVSTFTFFLYLELFVVPAVLVGTTSYVVVDRLT